MTERVGVEFQTTGGNRLLNEIRQINQGLQQLGRTAQQMAGHTAQMAQGQAQAAQASQQMAQGLNFARVAATALIAVNLGKKLVDWAGGMAQVAMRSQELSIVVNTLGNNAGYSSVYLDDLTQDIHDLGITTNASREIILRMIQSQVDLSHATDLARIAQDAAVIGMQDSSQAARGIVEAIAQLRTRLLKQYGIIINLNEAYRVYADEIGVTVESLDAQQRRTAMLNAILRQGVTISGAYEAAMESTGKRMRSLARHSEEVRRILGEAFLAGIGEGVDRLTELAEVVQDNENAFAALARQIGESGVPIVDFFADIAQGVTGAAAYNAVLEDIESSLNDIAPSIERVVAEQRDANDFWAWFADQVGFTAFLVGNDLVQGLDESADAMGEAGEMAAWSAEQMALIGDVAERLILYHHDLAKNKVPDLSEQVRRLTVEWQRGEISELEWAAGVEELGRRADVTRNNIADLEEEAAELHQLELDRWAIRAAHAMDTYTPAVINAARANREYANTVGEIREELQKARLIQFAQMPMQFSEGLAAARAEIQAFANEAASAGVDVAQQIADQQAEWERQRVEDARRANLEIRYWYEDMNAAIAANSEDLSDELIQELERRAATAQMMARHIAEYDAELAMDRLDAEEWYQQERMRIAQIADDEEREAALEALEAQYDQRVTRLEERAALERQIEEENRQRQIQAMRESGAAAGQAFNEEVLEGLGTMSEEWARLFRSWMHTSGEYWFIIAKNIREGAENVGNDLDKAEIFAGLVQDATDFVEHLNKIEEAGVSTGEEMAGLNEAFLLPKGRGFAQPMIDGMGFLQDATFETEEEIRNFIAAFDFEGEEGAIDILTGAVEDLGEALSNIDATYETEVRVTLDLPDDLTLQSPHTLLEYAIRNLREEMRDPIYFEIIPVGDFEMEDLQDIGSGLSSIASGFARLYQQRNIDPLDEQIDTLDEQIELYREQLAAGMYFGPSREHHIRRMEAMEHRRTQLVRQRAEQEERILELQEAQQDLRFLELQMQLLELMDEYDLGGLLEDLQLGADASLQDLIDVMTQAIEEIVQQMNNELEAGSPSKVFIRMGESIGEGLEVGVVDSMGRAMERMTAMVGNTIGSLPTITGPTYAAPTTRSTTSIQIGPNTISDGQSWNEFRTAVRRAVREDM